MSKYYSILWNEKVNNRVINYLFDFNLRIKNKVPVEGYALFFEACDSDLK